MAKGFLYVAYNSSMAGLLKIGHTEKVPTARLDELFTTGVPEPFEIAYYALVQDSKKSEKAVHQLLSRYRYKANREFFAISVGAAVRAIQTIETPEHEWHNPERSPLESSNTGLNDTSNHLINLVSRHGVAYEEKELEEFAQAIQRNNLHPFVLSAFYDSNSCCCQFTLAECVEEYSPLAEEIMAVALETIGQFEWFGYIKHGRGGSEDEF
ncbi:GIY-YIG nuclease family protein [Methylococcus geothermalis]|uniref:Bacteriophage T5 Orf172 DNA-binding domain-containing protein n=1 Tax=Methylococcus geothermalis TaxID=2681310 RepID=A0A858QAT2_9GAMM|nr:GIY-YIG nuclease family protein [Methylococcus geothermalis]QJD30933.1 hypothetical protein GNH96_13880 [Methylococcus geothermalis]